jgi:hypothetical protein
MIFISAKKINDIFTYTQILYLGFQEGFEAFCKKYNHHERIGDDKVHFMFLGDTENEVVWKSLRRTVIICQNSYVLSNKEQECVNLTSDDNLFIYEDQWDANWYFPEKIIKTNRFSIMEIE